MAKFKHKTPGLRPVLILAICGLTVFACSFHFMKSEETARAYPAGCVTQTCHDAADAAAAAEQAAASAAANAQTLEGEVARLNAEIASLEADIQASCC